MEGDLDPFEFVLAERLGKSLEEVRAMPNADFVAWRAFYVYRDSMAEMPKRG